MASTSSSPSPPGLSRTQVGGLISLMLVAGISNSMLTKYQDMQCVADCATDKPKLYEQPVFQTLTMFVGETFCLVALGALRSRQRLSTEAARRKEKYSKLPVDDSGVVLPNESAFTMRTVDNDGDSDVDEDDDEDDRTGVQAHKPVVGQDEVLPGVDEPVEEKTEKLEGSRTFLMWLPAIFDICGTTLMSVGLIYVPVSVYQMLRGALVLWVGLFSVLFLNRRLPFEQWASLGIVMGGVAVVGLSNSMTSSGGGGHEQASKVDVGKALIGAALVLFAQVFTASQFVIEEKIMTRYSLEPLKAVGLEGAFGLGTTMILMPILYFTLGHTSSGSGNGGFFDVPTGFHETFSNSTIWMTSLAICCSIAFFNFSGLAVTKNVSATARSLIDTSRTVGIWAVSLALGWEQLAGLQVLGFGMLVYGTLCFNEILPFPFRYFRESKVTLDDKEETVESPSRSKRPGFSRGRGSSSDAQPITIVRRDVPEAVPDERSPLL